MAVPSAFPSAACESASCSASPFLLISVLVKGSCSECLSDLHAWSRSPSCGRPHCTPALSTKICPTLGKSQEPLILPLRLVPVGFRKELINDGEGGWSLRVSGKVVGKETPPSLTSVAFTKPVTFCAASGHAGVLRCEHGISSLGPCSKSMSRECYHPY